MTGYLVYPELGILPVNKVEEKIRKLRAVKSDHSFITMVLKSKLGSKDIRK